MTVICAKKLYEGLLSFLAQSAENVRCGPRQKIMIHFAHHPEFRSPNILPSSWRLGLFHVSHIHTAIGHFSPCIKWTDPEITWGNTVGPSNRDRLISPNPGQLALPTGPLFPHSIFRKTRLSVISSDPPGRVSLLEFRSEDRMEGSLILPWPVDGRA